MMMICLIWAWNRVLEGWVEFLEASGICLNPLFGLRKVGKVFLDFTTLDNFCNFFVTL